MFAERWTRFAFPSALGKIRNLNRAETVCCLPISYIHTTTSFQMKKHFPLLSFFIFLISCSPQVDVAKAKQEMLQADRDMSALAAKEGFNKAIYQYAADSIVKLDQGSYPIIGKKDYGESFGERSGPTTISWEPVHAEVAQSGELGYTWGNWKFVKPDTTYYGNYFTAWKKDVDGKWKVMLDGGTDAPKPKM